MFLGKVQEVLECGENPRINYSLFLFHNVEIINSQGGDTSSSKYSVLLFHFGGVVMIAFLGRKLN